MARFRRLTHFTALLTCPDTRPQDDGAVELRESSLQTRSLLPRVLPNLGRGFRIGDTRISATVVCWHAMRAADFPAGEHFDLFQTRAEEYAMSMITTMTVRRSITTTGAATTRCVQSRLAALRRCVRRQMFYLAPADSAASRHDRRAMAARVSPGTAMTWTRTATTSPRLSKSWTSPKRSISAIPPAAVKSRAISAATAQACGQSRCAPSAAEAEDARESRSRR